MHFDLATRIVTLGVGELAGFSLGPRTSSGGAGGLWRAQLGQHWHSEFRTRAAEEPGARFEVPIGGDYTYRAWTFRLSGRIDQYLPSPAGGVRLRELKTVTRPLPAAEPELQAEFPGYFVQLAAYLVLHALAPDAEPARGELVFIEASTGLVQTIAAPAESTAILHGQLDELVGFLDARRRAAERRRGLPVRPAFAQFRPGQEHVQRDLRAALGLDTIPGVASPDSESSDSVAPLARAAIPEVGQTVPVEPSPSAQSTIRIPHSEIGNVLCFEAPTGFGKTGCLLEFALTALKDGIYDRLVYLTGKSTGQLQVIRQLETMLAPVTVGRTVPGEPSAAGNCPPPSTLSPFASRLPVWQVRSKAEHCVNALYHCLPDACPFIRDAAERWPGSGLARFYLLDSEPRDLDSLKAAGRAAGICPYEITRAALPYNDVWVGDYNYVFAPTNRGLFFEQPGFDAGATLLIVDEAHNLPARVADAYSHTVRASDAWTTYDALRAARAPASFILAWEAWARELDDLRPCEVLDGATEIGLRAAASRLATLVPATALDFVALGPTVAELLWELPELDEFLDAAELPKLLWCPTRGELRVTCLDAANAIAATLRQFRHAILTSATLNPPDAFATACGLDRAPVAKATKAFDLPAPVTERVSVSPPTPPVDLAATLGKLPRGAKKKLAGLTTGAALLRVEEEQTPPPVPFLRADTPWRRGAYRVGVDTRVDTRWERRTHHFEVTAATVAQLCAAAASGVGRDLGRAASVVPLARAANSATADLVAKRVSISTLAPEPSSNATAAPCCGAARESGDPPSPTEGLTASATPPLTSPLSPLASSLPTASHPVAVFFPSYAYAESVAQTCAASHPSLRIAQQPRGLDLAQQTEFIESALAAHDALFLVLGTGYTEGIDLLGGRVTHAMVVGPALPEVNAVQRAKLAHCNAKSRDAAFRLVYQVPGMQKVNQALGRLVRAPGHRATVLLHCCRFAEASYRELLDPELQNAVVLDSDETLAAWLSGHEIA
jgi:Rad3-related DNA helicase